LQLAIVDAKKNTPTIDGLLATCRSIVGHYKKSSTAKERLLALQKNEKILTPLMLIQDVTTRWNSEYLMLKRIDELKRFISADLIGSNSNIDNLTREQYSTIESLTCVLKPLYEATNDLCSASFPTAASVIFYLHYILGTLKNIQKNNSNYKARTFASKVIIGINSHFPMLKHNKILLLCTVIIIILSTNLGTIYYTTGEPQQFAKFRMIYTRTRTMMVIYIYTRPSRRNA